MNIDFLYMRLLKHINKYGETVTTRNSTVKRTFGDKLVFTSTPLVSIRKTAWKSALREWAWFMSGSNNIEALHPSVQPWWEPWADENGYVWNNYSEQFRDFHGRDGSVDQIELLIDGIRNHPFSRRNVITTWNTADMASSHTPITNCHSSLIQAFVNPDNRLHLLVNQRSVDTVCGVPHNWVQTWAFLMWLAHRTGRDVGSLIWIGGDIHIYQEHQDLIAKMKHAFDNKGVPETPQLVYTPTSDEFKADDFTLDREYHPVITDKAVMIV